jgi:HAE1 family hydrophobic/amphiphilic exporter-1
MNLAELSIRRPIFITCLVLVMIAVGLFSMSRLGVDLFPDVNFPLVAVVTNYPGAGPVEIETLISKPIEDEISTLSGLKRLTSANNEGVSRVYAEFTLETDIKFAEQQIRDRVGAVKPKLPTDVKEPVIRRLDPADQPIMILSLKAELSEAQLYDVANELIRPKLEQINQVGLVEIRGGRKREIQVSLDRHKIKDRQLAVTQVVNKIAAAGENIPSGKVNEAKQETVFRTLGEFKSLDAIRTTIVKLFGNESATMVGDLGEVRDTLVDETSRAYINGQQSLFLHVFRQSKANTVAVAEALKKQLGKLNPELDQLPGKPQLNLVMDGSSWIRANIVDVKESIFLGIALTIIVVLFFLGNLRSTLITGLALPNSLIGAFILMSMAGFTINIVTLLALSLSVGLLIDDAIVVRENIFRHIELGVDPMTAARRGTAEVRLAVIATTLTVLAVFGPVAFMKGFTGQFFKQFGLTICFAMIISLFDALTIAPMLSAYFAGKTDHGNDRSIWNLTMGRLLRGFGKFQDRLEAVYERLLRFTVRRSLLVLFLSLLIAIACFATVIFVPKTFFPPHDAGEFAVSLEMPPGTNLATMSEVALEADKIIQNNKEVTIRALTVGSRSGESNQAEFYIRLVSSKERQVTTTDMKNRLRDQLQPLAHANPKVRDYDPSGGQALPFNLMILSNDQTKLDEYSQKVFERLKKVPGLIDVDSSYRAGKSEFQIIPDPAKAQRLGISTRQLGNELRAAKYKPFLEAWRNDAPAIGLYQPQFLYVTRDSVHGMTARRLQAAADRYVNVQNWTAVVQNQVKP